MFGAQAHGFVLGPPASEAAVAEFEERHGIPLPGGYRSFVTELGDGGAGPGYRFRSLTALAGDPSPHWRTRAGESLLDRAGQLRGRAV